MDNSVEYSAMLEHAFMRSPEGMAVLSLNNGNGNWLKVNPTFCNLLGLTEAEFLAGAIFAEMEDRQAPSKGLSYRLVMDELRIHQRVTIRRNNAFVPKRVSRYGFP
ncbi:PAS domain-containing protein [Paenibacillus sp.]|uniref:PAS domain-containing protein n=1 Tax=Paenibacillus sp. TaxID=58172 RepID=UPI0028AC35B4|nr:PAS domain-containing protein [Paenibacillus sp.]